MSKRMFPKWLVTVHGETTWCVERWKWQDVIAYARCHGVHIQRYGKVAQNLQYKRHACHTVMFENGSARISVQNLDKSNDPTWR